MKSCILAALLFLSHLATARDDFPIVPDDIAVDLFAREPLVRNPCAITFDAKGRLCVGMGPQYRRPRPDTPGDSVWILLDEDGDGVADGRREFATGFNSIQGSFGCDRRCNFEVIDRARRVSEAVSVDSSEPLDGGEVRFRGVVPE